MKLYLVRHGETVEGKDGIVLGGLPGNLTDFGVQYAHSVAQYINSLSNKPGLIYSSDLNRALETAHIISEDTGIPYKTDILLRERGAGVAEGKKDIDIDWDEYELKKLPYRKHVGGESFSEVKSRLRSSLSELECGSDDGLILVTHSVVISMMLSLVLGFSYADALSFKYQNSIIILDTKEKRAVVEPLSEGMGH